MLFDKYLSHIYWHLHAADDAKSLNFNDRGSPVRKYNPEELLRKLQDKKRKDKMLATDPKHISKFAYRTVLCWTDCIYTEFCNPYFVLLEDILLL